MSYTDKTVANLKTEVRYLINEPTAMFITDTDLEAWINRGIGRAGMVSMYAESHGTDQLVTGTTEYSISDTIADADQIQIVAVLYLGAANNGESAYALSKTHVRQTGNNILYSLTGPPKEWYQVDNKVNIWPAPSSSENNHYIDIFYIDFQDSYVEANIPPYIQEYVIWYVLSKCYEKMGKYAIAQQYMAIFESFLMFHRLARYHRACDAKADMKIGDRTQIIEQS